MGLSSQRAEKRVLVRVRLSTRQGPPSPCLGHLLNPFLAPIPFDHILFLQSILDLIRWMLMQINRWLAIAVSVLSVGVAQHSNAASLPSVTDVTATPPLYSTRGTTPDISFTTGTLVVRSTTSLGAHPVLDVQNDSGNSLFRVRQDGKVGIATTVPTTLLDVNGDAQFGSGATKSTFSTSGALSMALDKSITLNGAGAQLNLALGMYLQVGRLALPTSGGVFFFDYPSAAPPSTPGGDIWISAGRDASTGPPNYTYSGGRIYLQGASVGGTGGSVYITAPRTGGFIVIGSDDDPQENNMPNAANVGIGRANPEAKLDVLQTHASDLYSLRVGTATTNAATPVYHLVLSTGGSLGIGTTSPSARLDVNGNAQFGSGSTKSTFTTLGSLFMASGSSITLAGPQGWVTTASSVTASSLFASSVQSPLYQPQSGNGNPVTLRANATSGSGEAGQVNIVGGESTLGLPTSAGGRITLTAGGDGYGGLGSVLTLFGATIVNGSSNHGGDATLSGGDSETANSAAVRGGHVTISGGRNPAVGSAATGASLTIGGGAGTGVQGNIYLMPGAGGSSQGFIGIGTTSPNTALVHISSENANNSATILLVSSGTSTGQELLVVRGDGKVGVKTTSPSTALDVNGDAQFAGNALKSTFTATPGNATYSLELSSGIKMAAGGIRWPDGSTQFTAPSVSTSNPSSAFTGTVTISSGTSGAFGITLSTAGVINLAGGLRLNGEPAMMFGGWYCAATGGSPSGSNNPLTGAQSCPPGFSSAQMFATGGLGNCSSGCVTFTCTMCYSISP